MLPCTSAHLAYWMSNQKPLTQKHYLHSDMQAGDGQGDNHDCPEQNPDPSEEGFDVDVAGSDETVVRVCAPCFVVDT